MTNTKRPVHNHGPEEGAGLSCREYRTGDGGLEGECLGGLWSCCCGWTNTTDNRECLRCMGAGA